jgi:hypothetical protein
MMLSMSGDFWSLHVASNSAMPASNPWNMFVFPSRFHALNSTRISNRGSWVCRERWHKHWVAVLRHQVTSPHFCTYHGFRSYHRAPCGHHLSNAPANAVLYPNKCLCALAHANAVPESMNTKYMVLSPLYMNKDSSTKYTSRQCVCFEHLSQWGQGQGGTERIHKSTYIYTQNTLPSYIHKLMSA